MRTLFIDESWDRFDEVMALVYDVLYRDFGVDKRSDWRQLGGMYVIALTAEDEVAGVARLLGVPGDPERQLRQVAVHPAAWGTGIGRALVSELERAALAEGSTSVVLNARDSAIGFYERLGYRVVGDLFVSELTRLPHHPMRKSL